MKTGALESGRSFTSEDTKRFAVAVKEYVRAATASKQKARQTLVELGIYTPSGKLTKRYS